MNKFLKFFERYRVIWALAWPQILMMFFHFWIGFIDVYVAGRLDPKVQASLGLVTQMLFFLLIVAMSFSNGAVSTISQSLGAGKILRAKRYGYLCMEIALIGGSFLLGVGLVFNSFFLKLLRTPSSLVPITGYFFKVYSLLLPIYYQFIVTNGIFRARKKVHIPLFSIMIVSILNGVGDFALCYGLWGLPRLGFKGLPWATFGSVLCGYLLNVTILAKDRWIVFREFPPIRWIKAFFPYLGKVTWPIGLNQLLWNSAYVVLFSLTASLPTRPVVALAAFAAGIRIESLLFLPAFGFNMTASILIGQALGHGDKTEARDMALRIWLLGAGIISVMGCVMWIFLSPLSRLLTTDPAVQQEIIRYLQYNIAAIPFTATTMILAGSFVGAGATTYNLICIGAMVWLVRVPCAYVLGHILWKNASGIWASMFISQFVQATTMLFLFFRGRWQDYALHVRKSGGR